jgi:hypothetical protein
MTDDTSRFAREPVTDEELERRQMTALKGLLDVIEGTAPDAAVSVGYTCQASQCCIQVTPGFLRRLVSRHVVGKLN